MNTQKQIVLIVVLSFLFVGGCAAYSAIDLPVRSGRQSDFFQSESIERGALLFANNCRTCHGIQGQGGVGLPLNKPEFKDQDPLALKNNRDLIRRTLYCGRAGTLMPAWLNSNGGSLNARQIEHIIDLLTAPVIDPNEKDADGNSTTKGWLQAVEFAENLNRAASATVGGDSLDSVAKTHQVGLAELSELNGGTGPDVLLKHGSTVKLPANGAYPKGRSYKVLKDNETLRKVADSQHVGAAILADLNKIKYSFDSKGNFALKDENGKTVPGLFPGDKIALPDNAIYVVKPADTLDAISAQHGVPAADISRANSAVTGSLKSGDPIDAERKLALPANAGAVVKAGQTAAAIATMHGIKPEDLLSANGLTADSVLKGGDTLKLPSGTKYTIQRGDTIDSVAQGHAVSADDLAKANNLKTTDLISPDVILTLPKIDKFVIKGQTLDDIAQSYSGVTADSFGQANGVPANAVLRVGQALRLPADTWGSAPPDTKNAGTACVQYAVPSSVFSTLPGVGSGAAAGGDPAAPKDVSSSVTITAHANDWTVTADGKDQDINKGAVSIKKGSSVAFANKAGLHTITINAKKDGANFNTGDTRTLTFNDAGTFKLTCDFHPDMKAWIYVQ